MIVRYLEALDHTNDVAPFTPGWVRDGLSKTGSKNI
jgi:hypothetical protein